MSSCKLLEVAVVEERPGGVCVHACVRGGG